MLSWLLVTRPMDRDSPLLVNGLRRSTDYNCELEQLLYRDCFRDNSNPGLLLHTNMKSELLLSSLTLAALQTHALTTSGPAPNPSTTICTVGLGYGCPTGSTCTPTMTCPTSGYCGGACISTPASNPSTTVCTVGLGYGCPTGSTCTPTMTCPTSGYCGGACISTPASTPSTTVCTVGLGYGCPTGSTCTPTMTCPTSGYCGGACISTAQSPTPTSCGSGQHNAMHCPQGYKCENRHGKKCDDDDADCHGTCVQKTESCSS